MKVALKTKNKGVKVETYGCRKCSEPIKAGDKYYEWKHRHAPPSRQHTSHGQPRQSELCTGKMSGVYAAIEGLEDTIAEARKTNDITGLVDALNTAAEEVDTVKEEYQSGLDNMPEPLQQSSSGDAIQEKIDGLEEFKDALENAAQEVETSVDEYDALEEPAEPEMVEPADDTEEAKEKAEEENDGNQKDYETAKNEFEAEQDRLREEAFERAESAAGELGI
jgi:chromosome segregation ATPase